MSGLTSVTDTSRVASPVWSLSPDTVRVKVTAPDRVRVLPDSVTREVSDTSDMER